MKTIVYKDVKASPFMVEYADICFHFSSLFNLRRFKTGVDSYVKDEELKIRNKYQLEIKLNKYLSIAYYKKIEKRGFYVSFQGVEFEEIYYIIKNKIERR